MEQWTIEMSSVPLVSEEVAERLGLTTVFPPTDLAVPWRLPVGGSHTHYWYPPQPEHKPGVALSAAYPQTSTRFDQLL
jgi:hypothetical protein